ncbi:MAG TPA: glycosyltransferase [Chitinophagaceae bacterium]|jgi:glycosyltransferase involved in cell wall biosynthesis|nr:glycosyltransferase [Chitinophagaceae bacterium]
MDISVVIPTCNRKTRLLSLLQNLDNSTYPIEEVIIVDSGEEKFLSEEYSIFKNLKVQYLSSERSVCIQRNIGILKSKSSWVFICDDDIEVPPDYLQKLTDHILQHPETGAISGLVLQKEKDKWVSQYPERSVSNLLWKYFFQLGLWGSIECANNSFLMRKIKAHYQNKGNHLSKAGWPVLTNFSGEYFTTPVYGLGASLIKKAWLLNSSYDEVLDKHGIGDHYGVAAGFPEPGIHILTGAFVYHHHETKNRLQNPLQYYRRVLALDYFTGPGKNLYRIKKRWLIWSLFGNLINLFFSLNSIMIKAAFKSFWIVVFGNNPYQQAAKKNLKVVEPQL